MYSPSIGTDGSHMSSNSNSKGTSQPSNGSKRSKRSNKTKKNKKRKNRQVTNLLPANTLTSAYVASLNDPFENQGVKLGWGCMVPTNLVTAYVKGSTAANADGTLALALLPEIKDMLIVANGGAAVDFATSATKLDATDQVAINANFTEGRVVSLGLRAYPNIPMTAAPGAVYVGAIPGLDAQELNAMTPNDLSASPFLKQFRAYEGGTAIGYPEDTRSFEFEEQAVGPDSGGATMLSSGADLNRSTPVVCFTGIGNASLVYFEAIINIEVIARSTHSSSAMSFNDKAPSGKLSDFWPSVEKLWSSVKPYLASAGRYGAQAALAAGTSALLGTSAKSVFGSYQSSAAQMTMKALKGFQLSG